MNIEKLGVLHAILSELPDVMCIYTRGLECGY